MERYTMVDIQFTGKYGDLIPKYGFRFQKMFANNYRSYWKNLYKHGPYVIVWQSGNEMTINDWHEMSGPVMKYLVEEKELPWRDYKNDLLSSNISPYLVLIANSDTGMVRDKNFAMDDSMFFYSLTMKEKGRYPTIEEVNCWEMKTGYNQKKELHISKEFYDMLMELWNTGLFRFCEV